MVLSDSINSFLKKIINISFPSTNFLPEEEQYVSPNFIEEANMKIVEGEEEKFAPVKVKSTSDEVKFEAFLDGIQRTVLWRRIPLPNGAIVPIHLAHIAAGVIIRSRDGKLFVDKDLIASRVLILGPFYGINLAGSKVALPSSVLSDTSLKTFDLPTDKSDEWMICDTTFKGTNIDRESQKKDALIGNILFNEGLVRSRAQARVSTLRHRLEFAILAKFRSKYPESWILVDGPLYFIDKWRKNAGEIFKKILGRSNNDFEEKLLYKAVGVIKSHRLRPKRPDLVIKIGPNERSLVSRLIFEVDIKGKHKEDDEVGYYGGAHLTWYTRLRCNLSPPYGLTGLIRLDVHRSTFGIKIIDALSPKNFNKYLPIVDGITKGVWRERWPSFRKGYDFKTASEPYPIHQVEEVLKSMLMSRRLLASFQFS